MTGVILAGGRSLRMGRDKATIPLAGEPLWQRQAATLRGAGAAHVNLVLRPEQAPPAVADTSAVRVLRDVLRGAGPIAGLHASLHARPLADWNLVLAVDLPRARSDWFRWLLGFCGEGIGAIVRQGSGYEPLAAIYPAAAGPIVAAQIGRGDYSLQRLAGRLVQTGLLRAIPLPAGARAQLANWNTPADLGFGQPDPAPNSDGVALAQS
jgi:molybdopterin-guanine dinucleotide biosynthesis protein A